MHSAVTSQGRLRLADHVRACAIEGQVVLLDLRRNRYIGIGGAHSQQLGRVVEGWPCGNGEPEPAGRPIDIDAFAAPLVTQGLLTRTPGSGLRRDVVEEVTCSLNADDAVSDPLIGWRRFGRLLQASTLTALQLRLRSLAAIADAAAARRARVASHSGPTSIDRLQEAVAAYLRMRLFVITAHDRCLHDSLTLLRFLAGERMFPRWVIGVRTRPFGAHSWLQSGATVLNDQHEHVRHYQPILVV